MSKREGEIKRKQEAERGIFQQFSNNIAQHLHPKSPKDASERQHPSPIHLKAKSLGEDA